MKRRRSRRRGRGGGEGQEKGLDIARRAAARRRADGGWPPSALDPRRGAAEGRQHGLPAGGNSQADEGTDEHAGGGACARCRRLRLWSVSERDVRPLRAARRHRPTAPPPARPAATHEAEAPPPTGARGGARGSVGLRAVDAPTSGRESTAPCGVFGASRGSRLEAGIALAYRGTRRCLSD